MWATEQDLRKITIDILILIPRHPFYLIGTSGRHHTRIHSMFPGSHSQVGHSFLEHLFCTLLCMHQDLGLKNKSHDTALATKKLKNQ